MSFGLPPLPSTVRILEGVAGGLLVADQVAQFFGIFPQRWGIFLDGEPVVLADNVLTLEFRQDWRLSTYNQEQGAFATYNKVAMPFEVKLRFSTGGSLSSRQAFQASIEAIAGDLNLYDVVTPEKIYLSCNVNHFDLKRAADSAGIMSIDVWLEEVRIAGAATFSNTKSPGAAGNVNGGLVQGAPVTRGPDLGAVT